MLTKKETKFYNAIMARLDEVQYIPLDDLPHCLEGLSHKVKTRFSPDGSVKEFIESFPSIFHISNNNNIWLTKTWLTEGIKHLLLNRGDASTSGATSPRLDSSAAGTISASSSSSHNDEVRIQPRSEVNEESFSRALQHALERVEAIHLEDLPHCLSELNHQAQTQFSTTREIKAFIARHSHTFHLSQFNNVLLKTRVLPPPHIASYHCKFQSDMVLLGVGENALSSGTDIVDSPSKDRLRGEGVVIHWMNDSGFINSLTVPRQKVYFNCGHLTNESRDPHRGDFVYFESVQSGLTGRSARWTATSVMVLNHTAGVHEDDDCNNSSDSLENTGIMPGLTGIFLPLDEDYGYILHGNDIALLPDKYQRSLPKTVTSGRPVHFDAVYVKERSDSSGGRLLMVTSVWIGSKRSQSCC